MDTQQSVAETQMSLEEIKEKMPDVYAQIKERRANPQPSGMLAMIKHDRVECTRAIAGAELDIATLKERYHQLSRLIEYCELHPDVLEFINSFDALPVPGRR